MVTLPLASVSVNDVNKFAEDCEEKPLFICVCLMDEMIAFNLEYPDGEFQEFWTSTKFSNKLSFNAFDEESKSQRLVEIGRENYVHIFQFKLIDGEYKEIHPVHEDMKYPAATQILYDLQKSPLIASMGYAMVVHRSLYYNIIDSVNLKSANESCMTSFTHNNYIIFFFNQPEAQTAAQCLGEFPFDLYEYDPDVAFHFLEKTYVEDLAVGHHVLT